MTKEYRVDIKVRNNLIVQKIEEAGYKTVGEFCRINNINVSQLGSIINLRESPMCRFQVSYKSAIAKAAQLLGCEPEELFTESQVNMALKTNKTHVMVEEASLKFMLENTASQEADVLALQDERRQLIDTALEKLTLREKAVIEARMFETKTLEEIATAIGASSRQSVKEIEKKALWKLSKNKILADYFHENKETFND